MSGNTTGHAPAERLELPDLDAVPAEASSSPKALFEYATARLDVWGERLEAARARLAECVPEELQATTRCLLNDVDRYAKREWTRVFVAGGGVPVQDRDALRTWVGLQRKVLDMAEQGRLWNEWLLFPSEGVEGEPQTLRIETVYHYAKPLLRAKPPVEPEPWQAGLRRLARRPLRPPDDALPPCELHRIARVAWHWMRELGIALEAPEPTAILDGAAARNILDLVEIQANRATPAEAEAFVEGRLKIERDTNTVWLDGVRYPAQDETGVRALLLIAQAQCEQRGMTRPQLVKAIHRERPREYLNRLAAPLAAIVQSQRGPNAQYIIQLPAPPRKK